MQVDMDAGRGSVYNAQYAHRHDAIGVKELEDQPRGRSALRGKRRTQDTHKDNWILNCSIAVKEKTRRWRVFENSGSPGRTRTYNSAVNSRVLYH